jgi:ankyrin repeat protein
VTNLLLSRGANIDVEDASGGTPLTSVLQRGHLIVLQLFLNHHQWVSTPQRLDFGEAVLLQAVDLQSEEVARFVVENEYASVSAQNAKGETPMHRAIVGRSPSLMRLLATMDPEGGSLIAASVELETPAHYAARFGSHREVETLVQCLTRAFGYLQRLGQDNPLNAANEEGLTSLYWTGCPTHGRPTQPAGSPTTSGADRGASAGRVSGDQ